MYPQLINYFTSFHTPNFPVGFPKNRVENETNSSATKTPLSIVNHSHFTPEHNMSSGCGHVTQTFQTTLSNQTFNFIFTDFFKLKKRSTFTLFQAIIHNL